MSVEEKPKKQLHNLKNYLCTRKFLSAFHWNSLWIVMAATILAITLAAVIIITQIIYDYADNVVNKYIEKNNAEFTNKVVYSINNYIQEMISVADDIDKLLNQSSAEELNHRLYILLRDDVETIAVFDENNNPIISTSHLGIRKDIAVTRQSWFTQASVGDGYLLSQPHVQRLYRGRYPWVITLTRSVSWQENGNVRTGIIMVDMNFNRIRDLCARDVEKDGYLYLIDEQGDIVYHPKQQMIYAGILPAEVSEIRTDNKGHDVVEQDGGRISVCTQALEGVPWRVCGIAFMNGLATYDAGLSVFILTAIIILSIVVLISSLLIAHLLIRPFHKLAVLMEQVSDKEETVLARETGIYEAGQLGAAFNRMTVRIQRLMTQICEEQKQLHKSELKALNAQINPHFLYNTLDSVVWLAESGDEQGVVQMVMALSKYFRLSLSGAKDFITVQDELNQVENYLIIQKMRFGDAFTYEIECEENIKEYKIPKILLQPIVENAIVHGVGIMEEDGRIKISAKSHDGELEMCVEDNGCGMKEEVVNRILKNNPASKSGIGLKNVHQRIQLTCGQEYGLKVESELDEGTRVYMRLPLNVAQTIDKEKEQK